MAAFSSARSAYIRFSLAFSASSSRNSRHVGDTRPDRSPVEILPSPNRRGVVILGRASATFSTPWFSPRRRDRDQDFIGTIHGDPTDVQLRDTEELFEYRCEAHGDLRLTVESRNPTLQHVPVRALSINPTRSAT